VGWWQSVGWPESRRLVFQVAESNGDSCLVFHAAIMIAACLLASKTQVPGVQALGRYPFMTVGSFRGLA
jgi:hypothetical protein